MAIQDAEFIVLEDGTRSIYSLSDNYYAGMPVTLDPTTGTLKPATNTTPVYGLAKLDANATNPENYAFGGFGAFGSMQLTVVCKGILLLAQSVYNEIEVNTSMTSSSTATTVDIFDATQTYSAGDLLYVNSSGLITNVESSNAASLFGRCLAPAAASSATLEVFVDCGATPPAALS